MPRILETVITTVSPAGRLHLAPMGVQVQGPEVLLQPFRPSTTLDNVLATGRAVLNLSDDVRIFAGCVTGRRDWPTVELPGGEGRRLAGCLAHAPLRLIDCRDDPQRPALRMAAGERQVHGAFAGFNRAQAAVIEGAVLVSRLAMLPADKVSREMAYLQIAIDKTAGPDELEAWGWLCEAVGAARRVAEAS